jgi:Cytochrome c oxidase subunit IV
MKVVMRIAFGLAVFILVADVVYYVASDEWRGSIFLLVLACAVTYLGLVFRGAVRRASIAPAPDTMAEEEIAEAEVSPTIWPFVISLAAILVVLGVVVATWLLIPGVILLVGAGAGWFMDIKRQWHPGELHAAAGRTPSPLQGQEQPDEGDRD